MFPSLAGGSLIKQVPLEKLLFDTNFFKRIDRIASYRGGLLKNFTRRALIASDQYWWAKDASDWKITIEHPLESPESATPDYWMNRALDLCEHESTHQIFGMTFKDLMQLDPSSFEMIEKRVYEYERRQAERMQKQDIKSDMKIK